MSGYGKNQEAYVYGKCIAAHLTGVCQGQTKENVHGHVYGHVHGLVHGLVRGLGLVQDAAATRPNQVPNYSSLAQPSFASQYAEAPTPLPHEPSKIEMPYIPSSTYQSRAASIYQADSSFIDATSRRSLSHPATHPPVTDVQITRNAIPSQGTAGSPLQIHLKSTYDVHKDCIKFFVMFGDKQCPATAINVEHNEDYYNYALSVQVPPFPLTNEWNPTMMLKIRLEDGEKKLIDQIEAGNFTFLDMSPELEYQSPPDLAKKRKYSSTTDFADGNDYPDAKRNNSMRLHARPRSTSTAYSAASMSPLPVVQPSLSSANYGYSGSGSGSGPGPAPSAYGMVKQSSYTPQLSPKALYSVPSGMGLSHNTGMKPPPMSPSLPTYSQQQYNSLAHSHRNPPAAAATTLATTPSRGSVMPSPNPLSTPMLVRATTLPQSGASSSGQSFNPYSIYPAKAVLKIDGDLDKMSESWSREEIDSKRRLVQFERSQHGSTITTSFAPVTLETRQPRSTCVSCILWEDKGDCYITSVDTIYLLEQLVNVRFTVEEKNRIRRNLEGFRPMTVSKAKSDSEEFFKVIMGFPNPKPRNIEKDVKVFPWKILAHALKKIISKYSASYSSTAGAGSLPAVSSSATYVPVGISQTVGPAHRYPSPRSAASSAASTVYTPSLTSTSLSPNPRASAGLDASPGQGISVPQRGPTGQGMTQWGAAATHHQVPPQYTAGLSQGGRASWEYGTYMDASAVTGVPPAAQSMQIQRSHVTPDLSQMPVDNPYQQYVRGTTRV
ncbi:hypothetical protein K504DRAFT_449855 [Pleomassaria siparia CBS 279.74]|uniref:DUF7082 domain-containing protein n=1 Tax=Pleomassaria siparia CBS 279.74 TaxID=1314801 RepID=A0A6G1KL31_9PLEO|nr:hypothetical protein K504DRAFT_449855 [Pleomassaria siparia CBS 279.74]